MPEPHPRWVLARFPFSDVIACVGRVCEVITSVSKTVQKNGNTVTFRDRKTVKNPQLETTPNLPVFKTAINTYQMQCREKTYRIIATELRNAQDVVVYQQSFGSQVPMQRITQGSPAQKQFESVCS